MVNEVWIDRNLTINSGAIFNHNNSSLIFQGLNGTGGGTQTVGGTVASLSLYELETSNTGGKVLLNLPTTVSNALTFTDGIIKIGTGSLTLTDESVITTIGSATSSAVRKVKQRRGGRVAEGARLESVFTVTP